MSLTFKTIKIPAADFPKENPLPDMGTPRTDGAPRLPDIPSGDSEIIPHAWGKINSILPYTFQDNYTRNKTVKEIEVAVLENSHIIATFIPRLGGRLWSLYDKDACRELLHKNPVFQPANLAIRNAWFSGGIEFNCGVFGHTPFTCSQVFVDRLHDEKRGDILRMYEYERVRKAVFQMDFYLPENSRQLYGRFSVTNTQNKEIPMYWWTNMALDEAEDIRIISPADGYIVYGKDFQRRVRSYPYSEEFPDVDSSFSTNVSRSNDFFYDIKDGTPHFEVAVNSLGDGFFQASSSRLKGRKLFVWGMRAGGRHWQEYLARKGCRYVELQAGIGQSQMEYVRMPALSKFQWLETYGRITADPAKTHGSWQDAKSECLNSIENLISFSDLENEVAETENLHNTKGVNVKKGSGWGALELKYRNVTDNCAGFPSHLYFDGSCITDIEAPWNSLIEIGEYPRKNTPYSFQVDSEWKDLLDEYVSKQGIDNPYALTQLGIMEHEHNNVHRAKELFEKALTAFNSASIQPSLELLYCLAVWENYYGNKDRSGELFEAACRLYCNEQSIVIKAAVFFWENSMYERYISIYESLPDSTKSIGRVKVYASRCYIEMNKLELGESLLMSSTDIPDIREGEIVLSDIWFRLQEKKISLSEGIEITDQLTERVRNECPVPKELDFRAITN